MTRTEETRIRMLLVDDEIEFLEAVTPPLVRRGFALTLAENGEAALRLAAQHSFDVAVLDVRMPGISGVDVFYRLKELDPKLPVIILTGHPAFPDAFQTSRDGAFEYLIKPCDVDRLAQVAQRAAEHRTQLQAAAPTAASPTLAGARVLLVGREAAYVEKLRIELTHGGIDVATADTTGDALRQVERVSFDAAVVDVASGSSKDARLVAGLKEAHPELGVIVLASRPSAQQAVDVLRSGAFVFLSRPDNGATLWRWIADAVASARQRRIQKAQKTVDRILDNQPD